MNIKNISFKIRNSLNFAELLKIINKFFILKFNTESEI